MAIFKYKSIRKMDPRPGVKYATEYYKQTASEYTRTYEHVKSVIAQVVEVAQNNNMSQDLESPLKGFPRTNRKDCYSAMDIMHDMLDQMDHERDIPSGMLGRWNRLFDNNQDLQIEMTEDKPANPLFNKLFYG